MSIPPAKILAVDDEPQYRYLIQLNLEASGYSVSVAEDGIAGLNKVVDENPDLVLLDVLMPGVDGFELCRQIRRFSNVPIILLTARADQKDVVAGLNAGADDYVTKPFSVEVLLARVNANLRRREIDRSPSAPAVVRTGELTIDRSRQRVFLGSAMDVDLDSSGRLLIAPELRTATGLERDVMLLGMGNHLELWDLKKHEEHEAQVMASEMPESLKNFSF